MTNEKKRFFDMLMKQLDTIPVEKLKEVYEPTTYKRALNYITKNQTIIIKLAEQNRPSEKKSVKIERTVI